MVQSLLWGVIGYSRLPVIGLRLGCHTTLRNPPNGSLAAPPLYLASIPTSPLSNSYPGGSNYMDPVSEMRPFTNQGHRFTVVALQSFLNRWLMPIHRKPRSVLCLVLVLTQPKTRTDVDLSAALPNDASVMGPLPTNQWDTL
jgi:hypothetical protein